MLVVDHVGDSEAAQNLVVEHRTPRTSRSVRRGGRARPRRTSRQQALLGRHRSASRGRIRRRRVRRSARSRRPAAAARQVGKELVLVSERQERPLGRLTSDAVDHGDDRLRPTLVRHPLLEALILVHRHRSYCAVSANPDPASSRGSPGLGGMGPSAGQVERALVSRSRRAVQPDWERRSGDSTRPPERRHDPKTEHVYDA